MSLLFGALVLLSILVVAGAAFAVWRRLPAAPAISSVSPPGPPAISSVSPPGPPAISSNTGAEPPAVSSITPPAISSNTPPKRSSLRRNPPWPAVRSYKRPPSSAGRLARPTPPPPSSVGLRRSRGCQVCPDGWAPSGAGCLAPPSYQGPCGRYSTFNGYRSQAQVDDWVRSCGDVSWSSPSCYAL